VVISVFNGFGYEIRSKIADTFGDLRVVNGGLLGDPDGLAEILEAKESVDTAVPYAQGIVMVLYENKPLAPIVEGIDVRSDREVQKYGNYLLDGSMDDFDDDSILVSSGFAGQLGLSVGDEVEMYTPLMMLKLLESDGSDVLLPRLVRIGGIFQTGWQRVDENTVISTLRLMQDLYNLGDGAHGIRVELKSGFETEREGREITESLGRPYYAQTWMDANGDYLSIIKLEKRMMFFLLFIIVIVASFSIMSSLLTFVIRKTREIGLFAAMGATPRQLAACFCFQGMIIGVAGTLLGIGFGRTLLYFRNDITSTLSSLLSVADSMNQIYGFAYLPARVQSGDLIVISLLSILIATLAGLVPAYKASKMNPVEALRSE
jgi:lipoprotein-releasing system permease protein